MYLNDRPISLYLIIPNGSTSSRHRMLKLYGENRMRECVCDGIYLVWRLLVGVEVRKENDGNPVH